MLCEIQIKRLSGMETRPAVRVLAQGMADNPLHIAALGSDRARRIEVLGLMFKALLEDSSREILGACWGSELVGALGYTRGFACRPQVRDLVKFAPALVASNVRAPAMAWWLTLWLRHDPPVPHSHLGPVAVTPEARGRGVGAALMHKYVQLLDKTGEVGHLETDSVQNLEFYRRFGFQVFRYQKVLNVPNWFMIRNTVT